MENKPIILAIETATSACSVALEYEGVLYQRYEEGNNIHSTVLLDLVAEVLSESRTLITDLDAIAVGQGPGSFTGIRVGVGVAQGIAYGADCPMIGVSSLQALASQSPEDGIIIAGLDARMNEIYWGVFEKNIDQVQLQGELRVNPPEEVMIPKELRDVGNIYLVGNAWTAYKDALLIDLIIGTKLINQVVFPNAVSVLNLSYQFHAEQQWSSAAEFVPEYVRNNVADKPKENRF